MWSDGDYYAASFSIYVSRRYHAKMRDYYQMLYNYTAGFNAFGASGAFVALLGSLTALERFFGPCCLALFVRFHF